MDKHFYLIRHAQSEANTGGISKPDREIGLSETGLLQAQSLVNRLPFAEHVFVSQMRRTHLTAEPYCHHWQRVPQILPELNEFSYLSFEQIRDLDADGRRPLSQTYWQRAEPDLRLAESCDSFHDFTGRVERFLNLVQQLPDGSIFFGHGIWIAMLAWKTLGLPTENGKDMAAFRLWQPHLPVENTSVWRLDVHGSHAHLYAV